MVSAPPLLIPVPFKVSALLKKGFRPLRSREAPLVTLIAAPPKALVLPAWSVPALIVVPPP